MCLPWMTVTASASRMKCKKKITVLHKNNIMLKESIGLNESYSTVDGNIRA